MSSSLTSSGAAVEFRRVTKTYRGQSGPTNVLDEVSSAVPSGCILTLVGPSGSGKSSLISLCNLLSTPDAGEVLVEGREVRQWQVQALRRHVGLAFQTPTMFPGTVEDNLGFGLGLCGKKLQNPEMLLERIGLSASLLNQRAEDLSGGQKQRVALARVLANEPHVLLLDEVTSALDPTAAREVESLILDIRASRNLTLLWVTHNLEQARRVGDFTWLLVNGRLVEVASTEDFFNAPQSELTARFLRGELGGNDSP